MPCLMDVPASTFKVANPKQALPPEPPSPPPPPPKRFDHHAPDADQVIRHAQVRAACKVAAAEVMQCAPDCRERSLALTKLEEAMMWANAAIAREVKR